jgi:hypothetical protein
MRIPSIVGAATALVLLACSGTSGTTNTSGGDAGATEANDSGDGLSPESGTTAHGPTDAGAPFVTDAGISAYIGTWTCAGSDPGTPSGTFQSELLITPNADGTMDVVEVTFDQNGIQSNSCGLGKWSVTHGVAKPLSGLSCSGQALSSVSLTLLSPTTLALSEDFTNVGLVSGTCTLK